MADWTTNAMETLDTVVATVRDKTVVPATRASHAVVYGLLVAFFAATAFVLLVIGAFRILVIATGEVWIAYLIVGGIFVLTGALAWSLRSPRRRAEDGRVA